MKLSLAHTAEITYVMVSPVIRVVMIAIYVIISVNRVHGLLIEEKTLVIN